VPHDAPFGLKITAGNLETMLSAKPTHGEHGRPIFGNVFVQQDARLGIPP
jgi:hypothetical protein